MSKLTIETLPRWDKRHPGMKIWDDGRGECVQITEDAEPIHVALIHIKGGATRGNHYHKKAEEIFFIMQGKVHLTIHDVESDTEEVYIIHAGTKIRIKPMTLHKFLALENTILVEYSTTPYDSADSYNEALNG